MTTTIKYGSNTIVTLEDDSDIVLDTNDSYLTGDIEVVTNVSGKEDKSNKVTSISSSSTDTLYPSAKCVYDALLITDSVTSKKYKLVIANGILGIDEVS